MNSSLEDIQTSVEPVLAPEFFFSVEDPSKKIDHDQPSTSGTQNLIQEISIDTDSDWEADTFKTKSVSLHRIFIC